MSALPKSVQAQIDKANEIVAAVYPQEELDADGNPIKKDDAENTPPKSADDAENTPPKDEVTPPKDEVTPPATPPKDDDDHKYKVLQGKYNAEVPRLKKDNDRLSRENDELRQRLLNLEGIVSSMQAVKEPPKADPKPDLPLITDDERAQFGDDLIDLVERVAKRATLPEIEAQLKPLAGHVKQVEGKVAHTETSVAESKRQQVLDRLAAAVPDFAQQNENPEFLEWLDQEEGMTGFTRGHFLTEAMKANDANKVIRYFTSFQSENAGDTGQPAPAEETPSEDPKTPEPQVKLDDLVAPGTPKTGTPSAPDESGKRVWTRADIAALYADKNEFIKKGKPVPKRLRQLEQDLFSAQQEGRLR